MDSRACFIDICIRRDRRVSICSAYDTLGGSVDLKEEGAGVLMNEALAPFTMLPWWLYADTPVPVPVLAQVPWLRPTSKSGFRIGLAVKLRLRRNCHAATSSSCTW
jgi:hypothetical protein